MNLLLLLTSLRNLIFHNLILKTTRFTLLIWNITWKEVFEVEKRRAISMVCEAEIARDLSTTDPASKASTGLVDSFGRARGAKTSPERANQPAKLPALASGVPG
jgi:hypothetical protein